MTRRRREFVAILGATGLAALAGCNATENDGAQATPTDGADTTTENSPTPTESSATPTDAPVTPTISPTTMVTPTSVSSPTRTPTATGTQSPDRQPLTTPATKIAANRGDSGDFFGISVAVSADGTTAIVGAPNDEHPNRADSGSAYVFTERDGDWTQQAKLVPDDGDRGDLFGTSVAVSDDGTTAIIGAWRDEDPNGPDAGSAYVFTAGDGEWSQAAKLAAPDGAEGDGFGGAVAVSADGTTAIVGASRDDNSDVRDAGSAYVFEESGGEWSLQSTLLSDDGLDGDLFGFPIAMSGDGTTAFIGATKDANSNSLDDAGSVYVFVQTDGTWTQETELIPADGGDNDRFGQAIGVSDAGTTAIICPRFPDVNNGGIGAGSGYVFEQTGGGWTQQTKLIADDTDVADVAFHSAAVTADATTAIFGAPGAEHPSAATTGSAYLFEETDEGWILRAKLAAEDGAGFGVSAGVSGDGTTAVIGAPGAEHPNGDDGGAAYVFELG
jgi:hypothetical protein